MENEWKQTIFTIEDFSGSGQYIIREGINKTNSPHISDTGHLSTIMYKVGYNLSVRGKDTKDNTYCLIAMSDGLVHEGYFTNTKNDLGERIDHDKWIWNEFSGDTTYAALSRLCTYLNNNPNKETYRKATHEELVRVANYSVHRTN